MVYDHPYWWFFVLLMCFAETPPPPPLQLVELTEDRQGAAALRVARLSGVLVAEAPPREDPTAPPRVVARQPRGHADSFLSSVF